MDVNPTVIGLGGAAGVLMFQYVWGRVVGTAEEKSIPVQLSEISAQLASIRSTLALVEQESRFRQQAFDELKHDFWKHMDNSHGWSAASGPRMPREPFQRDDLT